MNPHEIDNRIREELEGLQANPPVEAWLSIADAIEPKTVKRPVSAIIKIAAAISFLVMSSLSAWYFLSNEASQSVNLGQWAVSQPMEPIYDFTPLEYKTPSFSPSTKTINQFSYDLQVSQEQEVIALTPMHTGELETSPRPYHTILTVNKQLLSLDVKEKLSVAGVNGEQDQGFFSRVLSQNSIPATRVSFGAHFTPRYSYRKLQQSNNYYMQSIPFQSLEEQVLTYGMGVFLNYNMPGKWSIESGLNIINVGQYVKDIFSYTHPVNIPLFESTAKTGRFSHPQSVITSQGNIIFTDLYHYYSDVQSFRVLSDRQSIENSGLKSLRKSNEGLTQLFSYLEIPVALRYELFRSTFGVRLKAGMAGHYLLQNDVFIGTDITQNPVGETFGISRFNLSAFGGLSLDLPLTNKITFHLEPTAQIFLRPIAGRNMPYGQAYPYSFMLQSGVSYGL